MRFEVNPASYSKKLWLLEKVLTSKDRILIARFERPELAQATLAMLACSYEVKQGAEVVFEKFTATKEVEDGAESSHRGVCDPPA